MTEIISAFPCKKRYLAWKAQDVLLEAKIKPRQKTGLYFM
jgi:hypothetical protein